ncbi:hypothetical protein MOSE0_G06854 [Monosporozyma servazzii]
MNEKASTALGIISTICWSIQLCPQIWYNYKRRNCDGLPTSMMLIWVLSAIPFGIYFCVSAPNLVLQIQPHLFMFFCGISYIQTLYYPPVKMNRMKIIAIILAIILFDVGMEVGFILWLRPLYRRGITWPNLIFGILATVLLSVGLVPPYFELAKRKGRVVGINFWFLLVDSLGAWLAIASVIVGTIDVMGIILYSVVAAMELGIFASHFIWCCRFKWFGHAKLYEEEDEDAIESRQSNRYSKTRESYIENSKHDEAKIEMTDKNSILNPYIDEYGYNYDDGEGDITSMFEEGEISDYHPPNTSSIHAIHGVILHSNKGSSGSIKI